jgi:hypothetical protein
MEEDSMKKLLITTAVLCTALPFTFDGVTPTVSKAEAVIGRPLTPGSIAGVHRRAMRRTYGVGANLRYHPVARRAAIAVAATGAGYYGAGYGGWGGGWGWNRPLFASAGWGWNRPLFAYGGNGMGGAINVPAGSVPQPLYTETQMAAARYGCYPAPFDYSTRVCVPRYR